MQYIIDRFEGQTAVLEDHLGKILSVDRGLLLPDAVEGDVLELSEYGFKIDAEETARRQEKIRALEDDLFEDS